MRGSAVILNIVTGVMRRWASHNLEFCKLCFSQLTDTKISATAPARTLLAICKLTAAKTQHFLFIFNETPGGPAGAVGTRAGAENGYTTHLNVTRFVFGRSAGEIWSEVIKTPVRRRDT